MKECEIEQYLINHILDSKFDMIEDIEMQGKYRISCDIKVNYYNKMSNWGLGYDSDVRESIIEFKQYDLSRSDFSVSQTENGYCFIKIKYDKDIYVIPCSKIKLYRRNNYDGREINYDIIFYNEFNNDEIKLNLNKIIFFKLIGIVCLSKFYCVNDIYITLKKLLKLKELNPQIKIKMDGYSKFSKNYIEGKVYGIPGKLENKIVYELDFSHLKYIEPKITNLIPFDLFEEIYKEER